jgi:pyridoxal phosphate enzyme (YggS family)
MGTDIESAARHARERIAAAAARAGRRPEDVRLIAVTKGFGPEIARAALAAGLVQLGESRVQEAKRKIPAVANSSPSARPTWHLIGHLQSNKAGVAAQLFDWIHSIDSVRLAEAVNARRDETPVDVLIQIKTSTEAAKSGLATDAALDEVPRIAELPHLSVRGLMTIPPLDPDPQVARRAFRALSELAERLRALRSPRVRMDHLSMGMSGDFEIAIEEGATMVRLGTGLFGPRPARPAP